MKLFLISLILILISCEQPKPLKKKPLVQIDSSVKLTKKSLLPVYRSYINSNLIRFLDTNFPGWSIPAPEKWDNGWDSGLFNEYKTDTSLVNYISGDFDCNGSKDYCLIFTDYSGTVAVYEFLSKGNSFKAVKLIDIGQETDNSIKEWIELAPPGTYTYLDPENYEVTHSMNLYCTSVTINFDGDVETYYWDKGKVKSIITGSDD